MAAWYYQMAEALRAAGVGVHEPSVEQRAAYVEQLAGQFPELASTAREITAPRGYVPPPVLSAPAQVRENEGVHAAPPPPDPPPGASPAPPALVSPGAVKYE